MYFRVHRPVRLVLGGVGAGILAASPMPLGSLTELLTPPTLPGPDGMPLRPVVPPPAEPAFGVPTALPDPAAVAPDYSPRSRCHRALSSAGLLRPVDNPV